MAIRDSSLANMSTIISREREREGEGERERERGREGKREREREREGEREKRKEGGSNYSSIHSMTHCVHINVHILLYGY